MFSRKRIMIGVITLLVMAVTWAIADLAVNAITESFYYMLCGLWAGQVVLGVSMMELGKTDDRTVPYAWSNIAIGWLYALFTLIMVIPYACDARIEVLRVCHIVGLLVAVILYVMMGMARHSTGQLDKAQSAAIGRKRQFALVLGQFKMEHEAWLLEDQNMNRKYNDLLDKARFAAECFPGTEEIDEKIMDALSALNNAETLDDAKIKADKLGSLFDYRRSIIASLR